MEETVETPERRGPTAKQIRLTLMYMEAVDKWEKTQPKDRYPLSIQKANKYLDLTPEEQVLEYPHVIRALDNLLIWLDTMAYYGLSGNNDE